MMQRTGLLYLCLLATLQPGLIRAQNGHTAIEGKIATGGEATTSAGRAAAVSRQVLTGIDVLEQGNFAQLKQGKAQLIIGLLTNQTGLVAQP